MKTGKIVMCFIVLFSFYLYPWIKEGIYEAAYSGEIEALKQYIRDGVDLNKKDDGGDLPLTLAASFNKYEAVKLLLKNGANVNGKSGYSQTALMQADSTNILELLIKYGANIELKDKLEGDNALLLAATKCSKKKVELLLKLGMDINEINQLSQTPLIKAISNEYTKENKKLNFIKMLLENKADVNLRDENNKTAFIISKEKGYKNISKLLLQYGAKEESYVPNSQSLINALINKEYNRAKEMINSDIELNFVGTGDFSPLMCSIENIEVMKLLLEKGADVNLKNKMNMTALTMAVISNKQDAVKLLLENKADIHLKNYRGVTVLDVAKKTKNNPEMIKLLKDYGAKE